MPDRLKHVHFDHEKYSAKLLEDDRVAYMSVLLCVVAVAEISHKNPRLRWIDEKDLHTGYPVFAKSMDLPEAFYKTEGDECRAVNIFYRQENLKDRSDVAWVPIFLEVIWKEYNDLLDKHPEKERVLSASVESCKMIFPNWSWEDVNVTA